MAINNQPKIRAGCKDIWNAFMVDGAMFSANDIPFCPTTATNPPSDIISYTKAQTLFNQKRNAGDKKFFRNAFVHFYIDDQKFDGNVKGIWSDPHRAVEILRHFAGIITPDFSTCADFPIPLKIYNTYRMRAFGFWYGNLGYSVINNVRWGKEETFSYCFDGIPKNSIVSIGTTASGLRQADNREMFEVGFKRMLDVLKPHTIIIYGSDRYPWFDAVRDRIRIIAFKSETALAFGGRS